MKNKTHLHWSNTSSLSNTSRLSRSFPFTRAEKYLEDQNNNLCIQVKLDSFYVNKYITFINKMVLLIFFLALSIIRDFFFYIILWLIVSGQGQCYILSILACPTKSENYSTDWIDMDTIPLHYTWTEEKIQFKATSKSINALDWCPAKTSSSGRFCGEGKKSQNLVNFEKHKS